jgi:hypothetical protein
MMVHRLRLGGWKKIVWRLTVTKPVAIRKATFDVEQFGNVIRLSKCGFDICVKHLA